jgi:hypothetical protein
MKKRSVLKRDNKELNSNYIQLTDTKHKPEQKSCIQVDIISYFIY